MGFTGVVLVASLAMFRASMAIFNAGITLPPPFHRWDLSAMSKGEVATRKQWGVEAMRKSPIACQDGRSPGYRTVCGDETEWDRFGAFGAESDLFTVVD